MNVVDGCAGPGGFDLGARMLGIDPIGFEWDAAACATRAAAGLRTVRADVTQVAVEPMAGRVEGMLFSPPCQAFSAAGKGGGRKDLPLIWQALDDLASGIDSLAQLTAKAADPRSLVAVQPLRWALGIRPRWMGWEQVPPVLAIWERCARVLGAAGYHVWTGVLNAADYGVPQTRRRALLLASLDRRVSCPPPTHSGDPRVLGQHDLFGSPPPLPWVSMAEALGFGLIAEPSPVVMTARNRQTGHDVLRGSSWRADWLARAVADPGRWIVRSSRGTPTGERCGTHEFDPAERPAHTITGDTRDWELRVGVQTNATARPMTAPAPAPALFFGHQSGDVKWIHDRPATTIQGDPLVGRPGHKDREKGESQFERDSVRITVEQAAILQSFPPDYPFQGTKTARFRQVGDAVPPLLAAHCIAAAAGINLVTLASRGAAA